MKKTLMNFIALFFFIGTSAMAQISDKIYADANELKEMKGRTLLVALYEPNKANPKATETYNTLIQKVVKEHWTINTKIEFKPVAEIQKLAESKDSKYVLLLYHVLRDMGINGVTIVGGGDEAPVLQYQRCEKKVSMKDQYAYLPYTAVRQDKCLNEGDLIFTVTYLQKCIEYSISQGKQVKIADYYMEMAKGKCETALKSKPIICDDKHRFEKLKDEDIKENYSGKFSFVPTADISTAITNKASDKYVTVFCAWGIAKTATGAMLLCCKIIFDPSTSDIVYYFEPGGIGAITDNNIRAVDLKRMEKCKFK